MTQEHESYRFYQGGRGADWYRAEDYLALKDQRDELVKLVRDMLHWMRNRHHSACRWQETVSNEAERICTCFLEPLLIRAHSVLSDERK